MIRQSVTVPPPHCTNRYEARSRQPSAQDAGYMLLINSKKSQYSCSLAARTCSEGPAASATRTDSAHDGLKKSDIGSSPRQHRLHLLQPVLEGGREPDAHVVQLAPELLEEQHPHLLVGPAQRLVVDPPADHPGDRQDGPQRVVDLLDHRRVLAHRVLQVPHPALHVP